MIQRSVELQEFIKDFEYYLTEKEYLDALKCKRTIYFDANEIINLIRGIWVFDDIKVFDKVSFFSNRTLVNAFVYDGAFETIEMLTPHLNELINKLDQNHLFPNDVKLHSDVETFLNELFSNNPFKDLAKNPTEDEICAYLKRININAKTLFKVNYIFKEFLWKKRLAYLRKNDQILKIHSETIDFENITNSEIFIKLYAQLNTNRKKLLRNNFVDALSLTLFHNKLEAHKLNNTNPLPIFYCTSNVILESIRQLQKSDSKISFNYEYKGKLICTIRDAQFFIVKAIMLDDTDYFEDFINQSNNLKNAIKTELDNYVFTKAVLQKDFKDQVEERIERIIDIEFFEKVWYKRVGEKEILDSIINYINFNNNINNILVKKWLDDEKNSIEYEIRSQLIDYKFKHEEWLKNEKSRISNLEFQINDAFEVIRNDLFCGKYRGDGSLNVIKEHALTRFSFKEIVCKRIHAVYSSLLDHYDANNESKEFLTIQVNLTNDIVYGIYNSDKTDFTIGLATLWVFRQFDTLVAVFDKLNMNYDEYQLALLHCAAILRSSNRNDQKVLEILNGFEKAIKEDVLQSNYKVNLGLSYLYFNFWYKLSDSPMIPECMDDEYKKKMQAKSYYSYIERATQLILEVISYLGEIRNDDPQKLIYRNAKYYYAINNYCYYITMGGNFEEFQNLDLFIQKLKSCERDENSWLGRFNDTLANYYLRKAFYSHSLEEFHYCIEIANLRNIKSIESSRYEKRIYNSLSDEIKKISITNKFNQISS